MLLPPDGKKSCDLDRLGDSISLVTDQHSAIGKRWFIRIDHQPHSNLPTLSLMYYHQILFAQQKLRFSVIAYNCTEKKIEKTQSYLNIMKRTSAKLPKKTLPSIDDTNQCRLCSIFATKVCSLQGDGTLMFQNHFSSLNKMSCYIAKVIQVALSAIHILYHKYQSQILPQPVQSQTAISMRPLIAVTIVDEKTVWEMCSKLTAMIFIFPVKQ